MWRRLLATFDREREKDAADREHALRGETYFEAAEHYAQRFADLLASVRYDGTSGSQAVQTRGTGNKLALVASPETLRHAQALDHAFARLQMDGLITGLAIQRLRHEESLHKRTIEECAERNQQLSDSARQLAMQGRNDEARKLLEEAQSVDVEWKKAIDKRYDTSVRAAHAQMEALKRVLRSMATLQTELARVQSLMRADLKLERDDDEILEVFAVAAENSKALMNDLLAAVDREFDGRFDLDDSDNAATSPGS